MLVCSVGDRPLTGSPLCPCKEQLRGSSTLCQHTGHISTPWPTRRRVTPVQAKGDILMAGMAC